MELVLKEAGQSEVSEGLAQLEIQAIDDEIIALGDDIQVLNERRRKLLGRRNVAERRVEALPHADGLRDGVINRRSGEIDER